MFLFKRFLILLCICCFISQNLVAQNKSPNATFFQPDLRYKYLLGSTGILLSTAVVAFGTLLILPESISNWSDEDIANLGNNYIKKVNKGPIIDPDLLWLNIAAHPYVGAIYYMQPRTAGFSWVESAFFSFLFSTFFWEYGIEAFAEIPSWQDLILTPGLGSIIGEGFFRASRYIQNNDGKLWRSKILGTICLLLMDPVGFVMRDFGVAKAMGIKNKNVATLFIPQQQGFLASLRITW